MLAFSFGENMKPLSISGTGIKFTLSGTSQSATLPLTAGGQKCSFVYVSTTTGAYIRFGNGTVTAVDTDLLLMPGQGLVIAANTYDKIACLQAATAGQLVVTPLENQ